MSHGKVRRKVQKKFGGLLQDRLFVGGTLLLTEFIIMLLCITMLSERWLVVYHACNSLSIIMVVWLIRKYDNPAYKIAWIIVIMVFPLFGGIMYLTWGNTPFNRARATHRLEPLSPCFDETALKPATERLAEEKPEFARTARYVETICGLPAWDCSEGEFFCSGEEKFVSLQKELAKAKRFIFLEYFILEEGEFWNTILDLLVRKAAQGVEVRVMYDDAGCISKIPWNYDKYLCSLGIKAVRFNKFVPTLNTYLNNRDHRKILVIDGNVGYMGGINLADEYINKVVRFGYWKDTAVLVRGEAVVNMTEMFLQLWHSATGQEEPDHQQYYPQAGTRNGGCYIQPFGDSPLDNNSVGETVYMSIIHHAKRYVYITTPYLVIDNEMVTALTMAAQSGVDVRIITPGVPDKPLVYAVTRSFYQQLVRFGVKIYEYRPGFIHAKEIVADDEIAVVGTINMDFRSFFLHFECGTLFYGGKVPVSVRKDIEGCIRESTEVDEAFLRGMPWPVSVASSILRLFAPVM